MSKLVKGYDAGLLGETHLTTCSLNMHIGDIFGSRQLDYPRLCSVHRFRREVVCEAFKNKE